LIDSVALAVAGIDTTAGHPPLSAGRNH